MNFESLPLRLPVKPPVPRRTTHIFPEGPRSGKQEQRPSADMPLPYRLCRVSLVTFQSALGRDLSVFVAGVLLVPSQSALVAEASGARCRSNKIRIPSAGLDGWLRETSSHRVL